MKEDIKNSKPITSIVSGMFSGIGRWISISLLSLIPIGSAIVWWQSIVKIAFDVWSYISINWSILLNIILGTTILLVVAIKLLRNVHGRAVKFVQESIEKDPESVQYLLWFAATRQLQTSLEETSPRERKVITNSKPFHDLIRNGVLRAKYPGYNFYTIDEKVYRFLEQILAKSSENNPELRKMNIHTVEPFAKTFLKVLNNDYTYKLDKEVY